MTLPRRKPCPRCRKLKSLSRFPRLATALDGRDRICERCVGRYRYGVDCWAIYHRDGGRCGICDQPVRWEAAVFDHIIPRSQDGPDSIDNLHTAHYGCNASKSDRSLAEARALIAERGSPGPEDTRHEHFCPRCDGHALCRRRPCQHGSKRLCDRCWFDLPPRERERPAASFTYEVCYGCRGPVVTVHEADVCDGHEMGDGFLPAFHVHRHYRCDACGAELRSVANPTQMAREAGLRRAAIEIATKYLPEADQRAALSRDILALVDASQGTS